MCPGANIDIDYGNEFENLEPDVIGAPGTPTLEQLRTLVEVAETGSFTAAAAWMNRANSVVSYTIANLEAQLGLMLFDRATSRRPQLTEAGRIVLAEAQIVVGTVGTLRSKVHGMLEGLEGELSVVLDSLLPSGRVTDALKAFGAEFLGVTLHLHVETLGAVAKLLLDATATIGVSGPFVTRNEALRRIRVGLSSRPPARRGPRRRGSPASRPARGLRSLDPDEEPGFQRERQPDLAARRPVRQARFAAGRDRLGHDAARDSRRRPCGGTACAARAAKPDPVRLPGRRHPPKRHDARPGALPHLKCSFVSTCCRI